MDILLASAQSDLRFATIPAGAAIAAGLAVLLIAVSLLPAYRKLQTKEAVA